MATPMESTARSTASTVAPSGRLWTRGDGRPGPDAVSPGRSSTSPSEVSSPSRSATVERLSPVIAVSSERETDPEKWMRSSTAPRLWRRTSSVATPRRRPGPGSPIAVSVTSPEGFVGNSVVWTSVPSSVGRRHAGGSRGSLVLGRPRDPTGRVSEHVEEVQQVGVEASSASVAGPWRTPPPFVARPGELCHRVPPPRFRCVGGGVEALHASVGERALRTVMPKPGRQAVP